jgi:hypothetical protein
VLKHGSFGISSGATGIAEHIDGLRSGDLENNLGMFDTSLNDVVEGVYFNADSSTLSYVLWCGSLENYNILKSWADGGLKADQLT